MGGVSLLSQARAAGLVVTADGDRLVVRGPKQAGELAGKIMEHKAAVLAALAAEAALEVEISRFAAVAVPTPANGLADPRYVREIEAIHAHKWEVEA